MSNGTLDCSFHLLTCRIIFVLLHITDGFVLLTDVSIQQTWYTINDQISFSSGGLSGFNSTLASAFEDPALFWVYFPAIFTESRYVTSIAPQSDACMASPECVAYLFPGGLSSLSPVPQQQNASGSALIVYDTAGVQVEFYPPSETDAFESTDCRVYGTTGFAVQFCIQINNSDIIAGTLHYILARITNV